MTDVYFFGGDGGWGVEGGFILNLFRKINLFHNIFMYLQFTFAVSYFCHLSLATLGTATTENSS